MDPTHSRDLTAGEAPLDAALLAGDYVVPVGDKIIVGGTHEYDPEHFDAPVDSHTAEEYLLPKVS